MPAIAKLPCSSTVLNPLSSTQTHGHRSYCKTPAQLNCPDSSIQTHGHVSFCKTPMQFNRSGISIHAPLWIYKPHHLTVDGRKQAPSSHHQFHSSQYQARFHKRSISRKCRLKTHTPRSVFGIFPSSQLHPQVHHHLPLLPILSFRSTLPIFLSLKSLLHLLLGLTYSIPLEPPSNSLP